MTLRRALTYLALALGTAAGAGIVYVVLVALGR